MFSAWLKKLFHSKALLALYLGFFVCSEFSYSQNLPVSECAGIKTQGIGKTIQEVSAGSNSSPGFYKTDSIFSFQSPKGYVPSLYYNFRDQFTAPFKWKTKQWLILGSSVVITAAFIHFDNDIDKWATVQKQNHNWVNKSSPVITQFGSKYGIASVATIGLISAAFKNEKGVQTSLLASEALITSGFWVQIIKHLTGREDPSAAYIYSKKAGGQWWGPFVQYDQDNTITKSVSSFDAFPSGHTAVAFSIATVFASQYKDSKVIPALSYTMATLVGVSRLTEHAHWASDVFVGGLIGYLCGKQVVNRFNKLNQTPAGNLSLHKKKRMETTFFYAGNQAGFQVRW